MLRDLLRRAGIAAIESGDHVPAPLTHRGPDTVSVFEDGDTVYAIDDENADAWLAYTGPTTEAVN